MPGRIARAVSFAADAIAKAIILCAIAVLAVALLLWTLVLVPAVFAGALVWKVGQAVRSRLLGRAETMP